MDTKTKGRMRLIILIVTIIILLFSVFVLASCKAYDDSYLNCTELINETENEFFNLEWSYILFETLTK